MIFVTHIFIFKNININNNKSITIKNIISIIINKKYLNKINHFYNFPILMILFMYYSFAFIIVNICILIISINISFYLLQIVIFI